MGLVLTDIAPDCRSREPSTRGLATYEVRVAGELGEPLLRYLRWSHYAVPEQTLVRLAAGSADLHRFLRACTDCGASIERVRRVAARAAAASRSRTSTADLSLRELASRDRAAGRGVRPPRDGSRTACRRFP